MSKNALEIEVVEEARNHPFVQLLFEAMLASYHGTRVANQMGGIDTGHGVAQQEFYVKPSVYTQVPDMGAQLIDAQGLKGYEIRFRPVYDPESGVYRWKAENWIIRADNDGSQTTMLGGLVEAYDLAFRYDLSVVQAASNHYRAPIISTQRVSEGSIAEELWRRLGYTRTVANELYMERVFKPESK